MSSAVGDLVKALRAALLADAGVAAIVGARVYDVVPGDRRGLPDDALAPWVYVGPISAPRLENDCYRMWAPRVRLYCASDAFDRGPAWALADAVDAALDGQDLDFGNGFMMAAPLRAVESGDVIDPLTLRLVFCDFTCVVTRDASFNEG